MGEYFRDLLTTNVEEAKVILTGIPFDRNASVGKGASLAPKKIRELSSFLPPLTMNGNIIKEAKIFDNNDIEFQNEDIPQYFNRIKNTLAKSLMTDKFNLVIGGDHSIAIASESAFYDYAKSKNKIPAIIHIDAHPDICDVYEGSKYSHACPIRRAIDYGFEPKNIVLIGIRGYEEQEVEYFYKVPELEVYNSTFIHQNGIGKVINNLKNKFNDDYLIYLSYDIDANDPSFAPGTGTPEAFGLNSLDILQLILFIIKSFNVPMMDLVEIAPPLDVNDITTWLGLKTIYEVLNELLKK